MNNSEQLSLHPPRSHPGWKDKIVRQVYSSNLFLRKTAKARHDTFNHLIKIIQQAIMRWSVLMRSFVLFQFTLATARLLFVHRMV